MKRKAQHSRDILRAFMERRGLKPHPWAKMAGIRSSTLYNFLSGNSESLSTDTLQKLAKAANSTVDELLGETAAPNKTKPEPVRVSALIGIYGRLFDMDEGQGEAVVRPAGLPSNIDVIAARIDGDGLHPIPSGWLVYFDKTHSDPALSVGKMCAVTVKGKGRQVIRELRKGTKAGLYTLHAWNAAPIEDVEVDCAHQVVSISQPSGL